jgi:kynurenine formamidase
MGKRWQVRPEGSNWGEFGEDDQRGRLNLLTPEKVRQGIAEVTAGKTFCLSLPLDRPGRGLMPARHPPRRYATVRHGRPSYNFPMSSLDPDFTDVINDDAVLIHTQFSTQWDSLAHDLDIIEPRETQAPEDWARYEGIEAKALGIENMAETGVQGRAVLIDLHARFGRQRRLVGYDDLMQACEAGGVTVEEGDMLCLYTGFADLLLEMGRDTDVEALHASCAALDGRDERLLRWITDSGLAVLIADNYAVEALPATPGEGCCAALPLHEHCLFKLGVHLGELWYLSELAAWLKANGRSRFLLTAPPLRLPGAVGSPVTPVATV